MLQRIWSHKGTFIKQIVCMIYLITFWKTQTHFQVYMPWAWWILYPWSLQVWAQHGRKELWEMCWHVQRSALENEHYWWTFPVQRLVRYSKVVFRNTEKYEQFFKFVWSLCLSECQCNDLANRCVFDKAVFEASGGVSGGVCVGCRFVCFQ